MELVIRQAEKEDYLESELLTRKAFYNVYKPGCDEHLVLHKLRETKGFMKELDLVVEVDGKLVGSIVYSKGNIEGSKVKYATFGPIGVLPEFQGKGAGSLMITESLRIAKDLGIDAVVITGNPAYYSKFGFETASKYGLRMDGVSMEDGAPFFMVKILRDGALDNENGAYEFDSSYFVKPEEVEEFDREVLHL